ncbi:VOC family protein [Jeotgalibacillus sp. ET6]|uniref:VOC family protein n=1 Tax=Jeotgalibacillus sp. ET6 TaxID=3037260 RepID=UPI002418A951|nr:VOC family protein [Jeotgalibacillus sp. ET6]MDG5472791.1 VOC family protein [Jeotgalibacillus sp. ET6]
MIHHLEIYVSDLKQSHKYWSWLLGSLGWSPYQKWEKGFSYKCSEAYLVFVEAEEDFKEAGYHRKRIGLNHLAFHAQSKEHVDELAAEMKRRKERVLYESQYPFVGGPAHYALYGEDPDRIKVEIVAPAL